MTPVTQDELARLAKLIGRDISTDLVHYDQVDRIIVDSIIREALADWTPVPWGGETILVQVLEDDHGHFAMLYFDAEAVLPTYDLEEATGFPSLLAALEAVHKHDPT